MTKRKIEIEFINFIIDKYSPTINATASKEDEQSTDSDDQNEDEEVVEKLLKEYKKIKDQYESYSLHNKRK